MEPLKFSNPTFKSGLNLTIRLGNKWLNRFRKTEAKAWVLDALAILKETTSLPNCPPLPKVELVLVDGDDKVVGTGKIEFVQGTNFYNIPQEWLQFIDDIRCITLDGLYDSMKEWYGEDFEFSSEVTLIFFTVDKKSDNNLPTV